MNEKFPSISVPAVMQFVFAVALFAMSLIIAVPTPALSQWRAPVYRLDQPPETGIRFGKGRLHLLLGSYGGYDSNALYSGQNPQRDFVYRIVPGVNINWNANRYRLMTGYRFTFEDYWTQDAQDNQQHKAIFNLGFDINRRMELNVSEEFEDTSEPADVEILERLDRLENKAAVELLFKTPGADLDLGLKYENIYRRFSESAAALSLFNNRVSLTSRVNVSSHFRFLPKSILQANVSYGKTDYLEANTASGAANDSHGIAGNLGLTSPLSRAIRVTVGVGVSSIFFDAGPDTTSITGKIDAEFRMRERFKLLVGYERLTQVATFTNYYEGHIVKAEAELEFAKRMKLESQSRVVWLDFSGPSVVGGTVAREDFTIQTQLGFTYAVMSWCNARLAYQLDRRDTNAVDPILGTQTADFLRHRVDLGVEIIY